MLTIGVEGAKLLTALLCRDGTRMVQDGSHFPSNGEASIVVSGGGHHREGSHDVILDVRNETNYGITSFQRFTYRSCIQQVPGTSPKYAMLDGPNP